MRTYIQSNASCVKKNLRSTAGYFCAVSKEAEILAGQRQKKLFKYNRLTSSPRSIKVGYVSL